MQDLTTGPITRHLLKTTSFMLVMMVFQTLYFLIDLYWVGRIGTEAVAAVGIAGNLAWIVLGLSQMLGVGTTTLIAQAAGRKDGDAANEIFNQSQLLAMLFGVLFIAAGLAFRRSYTAALSSDPRTAELAAEYLLWFVPAMGLQFPLATMGAALRGTGNFKPGTLVATGTVLINMILAPVLIFGWGTGRAFGVAGAAMSSLIAIAVGIVWLATYFIRTDSFLHFNRSVRTPSGRLWRRMLGIGLPSGFEFGITAIYLALVYSLTRPFGAAAQAAFGIGMRVMQSGFMPVVALGFSVAPVAGQNFGARLPDRVKRTFADAAFMATGVMILFAIVCNVWPRQLIDAFTEDPQVVAIGAEYLRIISWNFVASGLIFVSSSMFQAMGNTLPSLFTAATRVVLVFVPALLLARSPDFQLAWLWYISVGAVLAQLALSLLLLRREFARRLRFDSVPA